MTTNVISSEYMELQKSIYALYDNWMETLSPQTIVKKEEVEVSTYPLLPQIEWQIDLKDYHRFLSDLFTVLKKNNAHLNEALQKVEELLDDETLTEWFEEAIMVNTYYFAQYAEKNQLPEWLPLFAAEHATRPYLRKAAIELAGEISEKEDHKGGCPVCGEPSRLAVMNKEGKKEITCPRCHYTWEEKKLSCAHCGTEEQGQVIVLKVEEDDRAEIYACKTCKGYTKVIDTRKWINVSSPELLDLKTLHLDYIAQEKGYGVSEGVDTH
ncbi:formate dehydrogenase accessory protein FdhE [Bacillus sp. V3B]|uniref:formate dehydrogenase accessory protein FdhE n=1 Tax=Bacillus sp. V3B TaxID=2804915 RepID=UPI00210AB774|nr:formate dehydrogenase accessory protein FdhE [Bacillus sp. V3B]MCQ6274536.1 formate dehydrogenase accessory protein FdhE [Bacillus sp. V3B]